MARHSSNNTKRLFVLLKTAFIFILKLGIMGRDFLSVVEYLVAKKPDISEGNGDQQQLKNRVLDLDSKRGQTRNYK